MIFWKYAEGMLEAELTGAEPEASLGIISRQGIRLDRIQRTDDLTVRFLCRRRDKKQIAGICRRRGDSIRFSGETGLYYLGKKIFRRPVLAAGLVLLLTATLCLPGMVLFLRVEGNERVPSRKILWAAEQCGIRFGASRREVRSEKMKNALLSAMPELKWAGINTAGCTAVISVREGEQEREEISSSGVSSIIAVRDAYITSCTVTRGNALCRPGQVVREGQTLISGYTDCGIVIQATQAQGEVMGETIRSVRCAAPAEYLAAEPTGSARRRISLIFGKKRINLWKGSGISTATCGRMYEEYYITLPGGFQLPVCLAVDTIFERELSAQHHPQEALEDRLRTFARAYILAQMNTGSILQEDLTVSEEGSLCVVEGRFLCREMIGRVITEEIGEIHGKTD